MSPKSRPLIRCGRWALLSAGFCLAMMSPQRARADDYIFTRLAHTSGMISQFPSLGPVLNNNGVAAIQAVLVDGRDAIVRLDGGTPTIIADDAGSFVFVGLPVDINDL